MGMDYDRGYDDTRDPAYLCPLCEHSEGEVVCPRCLEAGWGKCGCCEEYHQHLVTQPWACGCADDTLLCRECRESTAGDECSVCSGSITQTSEGEPYAKGEESHANDGE